MTRFLSTFIGKFIAGLVALGIVAALIGLLLVSTGSINLAANNQHSRLFYYVVHSTFKRWVSVLASDVEVPDDLEDEGRIALGAQHYAQNCTRCHGGPGLGQNPMALAMNPSPQHLPAVVDQFTDAELYVILEKGVMMSAMPAWPAADRPDEIWSTVAFIRQLGEMSADEYLALVAPETDASQTIAFGGAPEAADMDFYVDRYPMDEHLYSAPTGGFADYALAGIPIAQCSTCHGTDGDGLPTDGEAPNLTLQSPGYIRAALESYAAGDRHSGFMQVVASQLSGAQMDGLAAHYGDELETRPSPQDGPLDQALVDQGRALALEGRIADGIVACHDCHGREGTQTEGGIMVPQLAAQSETYITRQLQLFRENGRGQTSVWSPMTGVADNMTDDDIAAVSAYFASLDTDAPSPTEPELTPASVAQVQRSEDLITRICSDCHQADMMGDPDENVPNLSLQLTDYVERQLYDFRAQRRENEEMYQAAQQLSDDDIVALAAYMGGLQPVARGGDDPVSTDLALGEDIARNGLPEQGVPSCLTCHGNDSVNSIAQLPRLHGQSGSYLWARLEHFQDADPETITGYSPMPNIAAAMSEDQLQAAAAWFAEQDPLPKN